MCCYTWVVSLLYKGKITLLCCKTLVTWYISVIPRKNLYIFARIDCNVQGDELKKIPSEEVLEGARGSEPMETNIEEVHLPVRKKASCYVGLQI